MSILNFKEIPEAHLASGQQDNFELFARDFFEFAGYQIFRDPSRGADGGCDLILEESRTGVGGISKIKWLVSCKHKAHSGKSVGKTDEPEVLDSVTSNNCQGFIGFYSTLASSGLVSKVISVSSIQSQFFDSAKIEKKLLGSKEGRELAKRYFPISYAKWSIEEPVKALIFPDAQGLKCFQCKANLTETKTGIVVSWKSLNESQIDHSKNVSAFYWCCKGVCDRTLKSKYGKTGYSDSWEDIHDLCTPIIYIRYVMGLLNQFSYGDTFSEQAFEAIKIMFLELFPYVSRNLTEAEIESASFRMKLPNFLGGFG